MSRHPCTKALLRRHSRAAFNFALVRRQRLRRPQERPRCVGNSIEGFGCEVWHVCLLPVTARRALTSHLTIPSAVHHTVADKSWQKAAYTDEIAHLEVPPTAAGSNANGAA